ncbi:PEP-CTERM sorting domain-containing protein [Caldimonas brevitalea]|uniref:Ice-binding protein C-terminal domain-containing protein n=1 Tax=Caldimonas brevitalea TaxID=413882 RepID=A0A0G3BUN7_9BURK|nr:PEP-CTERM sorting domain-containing protein [Caldimonas brevitalea]AKJ31081.1 hypothetical protein AAW51_4390 [Caldimonas brevitalea]
MIQPVDRRTARARRTLARRRIALACAAFCCVGTAGAADFNWTGGGGPGASFWDVAANWSPSVPAGVEARLLLGAYNTTLRSGLFDVGSVQGTGTLTVSGGELRLNGAASTLGIFRMNGGRVSSPGPLTVQEFHWNAGEFSPDFGGPTTQIVVNGNASFGNGGNKYMGYQSTLELRGRSRWLDGQSSLSLQGTLNVGSTGRLEDVASSGDHYLEVGTAFRNAGVYEKAGRGRTDISLAGATFDNAGTLFVRQGTLAVQGTPSGEWRNTGVIDVGSGAALSMDLFRYEVLEHSGTVRVNGKATFSVDWSGLLSTGDWTVGRGGSLVFKNDGFDERGMPIEFLRGTLRNDGKVTFDGGRTSFRNGVALAGNMVELRNAAKVSTDTAVNVALLRIGGTVPMSNGPDVWGSFSAPDIRVNEFDWGVADLHVPGRITVTGNARLHGGAVSYTTDGNGNVEPGYSKVVNGWLSLGHASWSGETDIAGSGRISVASRRVFIDETAANLDANNGGRPIRLGVARFDNNGTYRKIGAGTTESTGTFNNAGTLRVEGTGQMIFSGTLNNTGTLEARGARIDVRGSLAQWSAADRRLTGGTYLSNGNVIGLNLGSAAGIARNSARIELRGAAARLFNNHGGVDREALASLTLNDGSLRVLEGASVKTDAGLTNQGSIAVGEGSVLEVAGLYRQSGSRSQTWIDGLLQADSIEFAGGLWGAGLENAIGSASLTGAEVRFGSGRLDVDIAGAGSYDVVSISGHAVLGGTLFAEFSDAALAEGQYRVLTATGGLDGSFAILTNLDLAQYQVDAIYGGDHVDLRVTRVASAAGLSVGADVMAMGLPAAPVPEPETYALMAAGLALLVWRKRGLRRG